MQRLSNRSHSGKSHAGPQVQHVERVIEVMVQEPAQHTHTEHIVEVPVERIIEVEKRVEVPIEVDLSIINTHISNHEEYLRSLTARINRVIEATQPELEMQRRALVAIKAQRDIDRSRRLMLMKRIKKEHEAHKKIALKLKLAMGASLLISLVSLIVKL